MSATLENKLSHLIHEINEIKKELVPREIKKAHAVKRRLSKWKALGVKISSKWNNITAVEEISQQREKSW